MRILAVLPLVPWPLDRGDRMRAWELLHELAARGELSVVLLTRESVDAVARAALAELTGSVLTFDVGNVAWNAVVGMAHRLPPALGAYWNPRIANILGGIMNAGCDLAVAYQLRAAPYVVAARSSTKAIDFTDSLAMFRRDLPYWGRSGWQRLALTGVDRIEKQAARQFDICWVSAPNDARSIAELSGRTPVIVPNGCEPMSDPPPYESRGPLVFVGDMRYPANEDGIRVFVASVWPVIREAVAGCRLEIIGRPTPRIVRVAARAGVDVLGPLPDVSGHIARAGAIINPVRFGSGSSRKVLTGWAAARPVISTSTGARGLAYAEGRELMIADTPQQWLAAIQWLRAHPNAAADLGRAGWIKARKLHDAQRVWANAMLSVEPAMPIAPRKPIASGAVD